ncbi:MAG: ribosome small subunit-dependent GTPase A [Candidatus Eisenbacteria bacterium]|nr:ribosome small subunit-dependent GTPase A [Candidatus Latescibacterota bacterium]MBD3302057.1 ribosome small subunit-dependent GTPase A [Candidatus Eisenbacteria bacterium]
MPSGDGVRMPQGTVIRVQGPQVIVRIRGRDRHAALRGALKAGRRQATHPVVTGDLVRLGGDEAGGWAVEGIVERRNLVARVDPGDPRRMHGIAANVDQLVCLQSFRDPPLNLRSLDRFLLLGESAGIPPAIVVNKDDLRTGSPPSELDFYPRIGIPVLLASAKEGTAIEGLRRLIAGKQSVLVGPSGVGKSSLLNRTIPGLHLPTRAVSRATSKGTHTTVRVEWIDLPEGGAVLDTPGLRVVQPWGLRPDRLAMLFREFEPYADCQYADCLHRKEPACGVRSAVEEGRIPAFRYDSYLRILTSLDEEANRIKRRGESRR